MKYVSKRDAARTKAADAARLQMRMVLWMRDEEEADYARQMLQKIGPKASERVTVRVEPKFPKRKGCREPIEYLFRSQKQRRHGDWHEP